MATADLTRSILAAFAEETGLSSDRPPRRYLWTDAFAVCGFLGLYEDTAEEAWLDLATSLVDHVHRVLGRHRHDDPRSGWISGLDEETGARHPTAGGLRIGKPEPERSTATPYEPRREWDRDGQYYHYLTRWMHALNRVWAVTGEPEYHRWAVELASAAHEGFVDRSGAGAPRLFWKVSIDLSRPLVPSMGQHDPLDGRIVAEALRATAPETAGRPDGLLDLQVRELDRICMDAPWSTHDPLGVGSLLVDALRLVQLRDRGRPVSSSLEAAVFRDSLVSLEACRRSASFDQPADRRLAFRELGLAIGLHAIDRIEEDATGEVAGLDEEWLRAVREHQPVAGRIELFWSRSANRAVDTWTAHRDINAVMLAVSLSPAGYLRM